MQYLYIAFQCTWITLVSLDELRIILIDQAIDVFLVMFDDELEMMFDDKLEIEGYNLLRKDRSYANGCGVAVCIKNKHAFSHRPELETANLESLWLKESKRFLHSFLKIPKSKSLLISVVYRPPQDDYFFDKFGLELDAIDQAHEYLVLGDLKIVICKDVCQRQKSSKH